MKSDLKGAASYAGVENNKASWLQPLLARVQEAVLSHSWQSVVWSINGFFIAVTVVYPYLPDNRAGMMKFVGLFSLQFEKNLATYWEGLCLIVVALLAAELFFNTEKTAIYERRAWMGLAALTAGLSLDEIGSVHERAPFLFSGWGLDGMFTLVPLAVPAVLILLFTLYNMLRLPDRRCFWLTVSAFAVLGSVVFHEYLEHRVNWPFWLKGIRFALEEGTELAGIFLLLTVVLNPARGSQKFRPALDLLPSLDTLIRLKSTVVALTLLGFVPLAFLTLVVDDYGTPAVWLPFVLLTFSCTAGWYGSRLFPAYRNRFLLASGLALFFSLDQIIVFQRVLDINAVRGEIEKLMIFCMAAACLSIPILRSRRNLFLFAALLTLNLAFIPASEVYPWLIIPLQALGVFFILVDGCSPAFGRRAVSGKP